MGIMNSGGGSYGRSPDAGEQRIVWEHQPTPDAVLAVRRLGIEPELAARWCKVSMEKLNQMLAERDMRYKADGCSITAVRVEGKQKKPPETSPAPQDCEV